MFFQIKNFFNKKKFMNKTLLLNIEMIKNLSDKLRTKKTKKQKTFILKIQNITAYFSLSFRFPCVSSTLINKGTTNVQYLF